MLQAIKNTTTLLSNAKEIRKLKNEIPKSTYNALAIEHNQALFDHSNDVSKFIVGAFVFGFALLMLFGAGKTTGQAEIRQAVASKPSTSETQEAIKSESITTKPSCNLIDGTCKNQNKF